MNERIDELLDKAKLTAVQEMFEEELYEFAELIVKECAEIAKTAEPYRSDDLILRHFGVEPNE